MEDTTYDVSDVTVRNDLYRITHKTWDYVWLYSQKEINIYEHISLIAAALNACINFTVTFLPDEYQELSLFITGIVNIITLTFTAFYKIFTTKAVPIEKEMISTEWEKLNKEATYLLKRVNVRLNFEKTVSEKTLDNDIINEYVRISKNCNELFHRSRAIPHTKNAEKSLKKYKQNLIEEISL